ncbi:hypothetical protein K445DRAFT_237288 [Daldinia sp. EC12]|nr:hypothetical protein K445DRAFT_237288 [Daldinia sp. EC12]
MHLCRLTGIWGAPHLSFTLAAHDIGLLGNFHWLYVQSLKADQSDVNVHMLRSMYTYLRRQHSASGSVAEQQPCLYTHFLRDGKDKTQTSLKILEDLGCHGNSSYGIGMLY